ncbi:MAG: hypothetical protein GWO11_03165 [Desulfuromonadales bacterium]|nr:hypothetical protein [Desulfuromonadales bacterium]NIR33463.1 hypothetical protein [Desulfuromonadales bacterium]NIS42231.1 hypothetical protein [Desulfuromonadales bacterium]
MIYLCNSEQGNLAVYLDVHAMERQERGFALSGTLGDGHYEGDVMVEVGVDVAITFADRWLDRDGLETFFDRVDKRMVESALADAARTVVDGRSDRQCPDRLSGGFAATDSEPHRAYGRRQDSVPVVSSGEALWSPSA